MTDALGRSGGIVLLVAAIIAAHPPALRAQPAGEPPLKWVQGRITQILVQPRESYYVFNLRQANGTGTLLRLCDPHTGAVSAVEANNLLYDLLRESFFRGQKVQAGVRDFGHDRQSGSPKICVDRVSLFK
jgi:hypothetical protein